MNFPNQNGLFRLKNWSVIMEVFRPDYILSNLSKLGSFLYWKMPTEIDKGVVNFHKTKIKYDNKLKYSFVNHI